MSREADAHEWASRLMFNDNGDNFLRSNRNLDLATEPRITLWMLIGQDVESGNGDAATDRLPRTSNTASLDGSSESSSDLGEEELAEDTLTSDVACSAEDEPEPLDQSFSESSFELGLWSSESSLHLQSLFDQTPVHLFNIVQQPTTSGHPTNKPKDVDPKVQRRKGLCGFFRKYFSKKKASQAQGPTKRPPWTGLFGRASGGKSRRRSFPSILINGRLGSLTPPFSIPLPFSSSARPGSSILSLPFIVASVLRLI